MCTTFISNQREELENEKKKNDALRSLFPQTFDGVENDTVYVLTDDKWNVKRKFSSDSLANEEKNKVVESKSIGGEFNMDPWNFEKMADNSQYGIKVGLDGKLDTIPLKRIEYGDNYERINTKKFESLIPYSLKHEGGYVNDSDDSGGETKYGITKIFYDEYKNKVPDTLSPTIKGLTLEDAKKLYKAQWDRYRLGYIRDKRKALLLNDYMINSYAKSVAKRLQNMLNNRGYNLKVDGDIGENTINAINDIDFNTFAIDLQTDRRNKYEEEVDRVPIKKKFIKGWINRLNELNDSVNLGVKFKSKYFK